MATIDGAVEPAPAPVPAPELEAATLPITTNDTTTLPITTTNNYFQSDLSADDIALYDRQIRLWGIEAQTRLRNAHVLLVTVRALGNEIAKNLVLAGIGSLTLIDDELVTEDDLGAQFLVTEEDIGKSRAEAAAPRIRELNPRVPIHVHGATLDALLGTLSATVDGPSLEMSPYSLMIATDLPYPTLTLLNAAARLAGKPFYAGGSLGMYGFVFADLITHEFSIERARSNDPNGTQAGRAETPTRTIMGVQASRDADGKPVELVTKREEYQPLILANSSPLPPSILASRRRLRNVSPLLPCLRALWDFESRFTPPRQPSHNATDLSLFTTLATEKSRELQLPIDLLKAEFLRAFLQGLGAEIAPVAAVLGATLAQDVLNVVQAKEQPLQNLCLLEGEEGRAECYALFPMVTTGDGGVL